MRSAWRGCTFFAITAFAITAFAIPSAALSLAASQRHAEVEDRLADYSGMVLKSTEGFVAPAGAPKPIVDKISRDLRELLQTQEVGERLRKLGFILVGATPEDYRANVQRELKSGGSWSKRRA